MHSLQHFAAPERLVIAFLQNSCLHRCLLTLIFLQLPKLNSADFDVIGPPGPILALVGEEAELPCHLNPQMSAERMELRWFRNTLSSVVLAYRKGVEQDKRQMPEYRGRTTLVKDRISSGRVAVRIHPVRVSDEGMYGCVFKVKQVYDEAFIHLKVAALGSEPHIDMETKESGEIQLECSSNGWYPEPQVQWRTSQGEKLPSTSESSKTDEEGLFTVAASLTLRKNYQESVFCCIQNLRLGQMKEVAFSIPAPSLASWIIWTLVAICIGIVLIIGLIVFILKKEKKKKRQRKHDNPDREMQLFGDLSRTLNNTHLDRW